MCLNVNCQNNETSNFPVLVFLPWQSQELRWATTQHFSSTSGSRVAKKNSCHLVAGIIGSLRYFPLVFSTWTFVARRLDDDRTDHAHFLRVSKRVSPTAPLSVFSTILVEAIGQKVERGKIWQKLAVLKVVQRSILIK